MLAAEESHRDSAETMRVVQGSRYLRDSAFTTTTERTTNVTIEPHKKVRSWSPGLSLIGIGIGLMCLPIVWLRGLPLSTTLIMPIAFTLFGIALQQVKNARVTRIKTTSVKTVETVKDEMFAKGLKGEIKVEQLLRNCLNNDWTLYKNVLLQQRSDDIDAILVGPSGVYVLEIKAFSGNYRFDGTQWEFQTKNHKWVKVDKNPMEQLVSNRNRIYHHLRAKAINVPVRGRLVWAGDGYVKAVGHQKDLWFTKNGAKWIKNDIAKGQMLDDDTVESVHAELTRLCIAAAQSTSMAADVPF